MLVVEDDVSILRALVDKLTREGFIVFQGKNGEEGLALALAERPDIILLDILMPIMDGSTMMKGITPYALEEESAKKLWALSEELTGINFNI